MLTKFLIFFTFLVFSGQLLAQSSPSAQKDYSIVKVQVFNKQNKIISRGTGFFISSSGLIMTTRHVFNKFFKDNDSKIGISNYMGDSATNIELVNCNKRSDSDVCILKASGFKIGPRLSLDTPLPPNPKDDSFQVYGLCKSHKLSRQTSLINDLKFSDIKDYKIRQKLGSEETADFKGFFKTRFLEISEYVCKGDSGGPVIDKKGRVVGMIVSMAGDRSWAIHGKDLTKFERRGSISEVLPKHRVHIKVNNLTDGQKRRRNLFFSGLKRK